jgi:hypothetical protein
MRWDEWRFSATRAWQDHVVRWMTLVTVVFDLAIAGLFLWKIVPLAAGSGILTYHYNIYLGIDDVRAWQWMLVPTGTMIGFILLNTLVAYGVYRQDRLAARAMMLLTIFLSVLWAITLYYLVTINR